MRTGQRASQPPSKIHEQLWGVGCYLNLRAAHALAVDAGGNFAIVGCPFLTEQWNMDARQVERICRRMSIALTNDDPRHAHAILDDVFSGRVDIFDMPVAERLELPVTALGLPTRVCGLLERLGCRTIGDVRQLSTVTILEAPRCGTGVVRDVDTALGRMGLRRRG